MSIAVWRWPGSTTTRDPGTAAWATATPSLKASRLSPPCSSMVGTSRPRNRDGSNRSSASARSSRGMVCAAAIRAAQAGSALMASICSGGTPATSRMK